MKGAQGRTFLYRVLLSSLCSCCLLVPETGSGLSAQVNPPDTAIRSPVTRPIPAMRGTPPPAQCIRLAEAAERSLRHHLLFIVAADNTGRVQAFGFDPTRGNRCSTANSLRPELLRQHAGHGVERTLGRGINRAGWHGGGVLDIELMFHDTAALIAKQLDCFLRRKDRAKHVGVELAVELGFGDFLDGIELVDAGVVHQHVEFAVGLAFSANSAFTSAALDMSAFTAMALPPFAAISATTFSAPRRLEA